MTATAAHALDATGLARAVRAEEERLQARIGVAVLDTADGSNWQYRGDERFALNSTHKAFACAALLAQVDAGRLALDQRLTIDREDLVAYSPITEKTLSPQTTTLGELCAAAVSYSDNTAGNAVLAAIGGPAYLTAYMRALGDPQTRLDRLEPELNAATPGDPRDTTTPAAAVASLHRILFGAALSTASRDVLTQWMCDDRVADALLRAALPADWRIADKTGAGGYGSRSIIAAIWPADRAPVVVGVYLTQTAAPLAARNEAIARIGGALKAALEGPGRGGEPPGAAP